MTGSNKAQSVAGEVSTGGSLISDAKLQQLYADMLHCRLLAEYAAGVRKTARSVNPYQASTGQEASAAGWVSDLEPHDTIALGERDLAPAIVKGAALEDLVAPLYANRNGRSSGVDHILEFTSIEEQGAAIIEAGFAAKRKKKRAVVVAFASAPAAAQDPWQEMVSKATRKKLPIVFVVENNPWPAAAKLSSSSAVDLAAIARANEISCIPVDGNDVVAVYRVAFESLDRLRQGDGPFLVEAKTYSDASRSKRSVERDPLVHMEHYLKAKKLFTAEWKDHVVDDFSKKLKQAAKAARQRNK